MRVIVHIALFLHIGPGIQDNSKLSPFVGSGIMTIQIPSLDQPHPTILSKITEKVGGGRSHESLGGYPANHTINVDRSGMGHRKIACSTIGLFMDLEEFRAPL